MSSCLWKALQPSPASVSGQLDALGTGFTLATGFLLKSQGFRPSPGEQSSSPHSMEIEGTDVHIPCHGCVHVNATCAGIYICALAHGYPMYKRSGMHI